MSGVRSIDEGFGGKAMMDNKRLNAAEQQALFAMFAALNALKDSEDLDGRLTQIKGAKSWRNGALGMIRKTCEGVMESMPAEQIQSVKRNLKTLRYYIAVAKPGGRSYKDDGRWLSYDALDTLCEAAQERCLVCMKNKQEQRKCPLAKALDELPCAKAYEQSDGCRYFSGLV